MIRHGAAMEALLKFQGEIILTPIVTASKLRETLRQEVFLLSE